MVVGNKNTTEHIINRLENNQRVCYVRYGDGDFIAMYPESINQVIGKNNQSYITEDVQQKLIDSYCIDKEDYLVGTLQDIRHPRSTINNIDFNKLDTLNLSHPSTLYSAIALQESFLDYPQDFLKFIKLINNKKTLYINHYVEPILVKFIGDIKFHIKVSKYNASGTYREVLKLLNQIKSTDTNFDQIILSCGQLSRVLSKDLYEMFPDKNIFDFGSLSDKLIIKTPSYNNISVRGHIAQNFELINNRINYFLNEINK